MEGRGGAYCLEDAGDNFVSWHVAVVLEEVADWGLDCGDGRIVPAYVAVSGADWEAWLD